MSAAQRSRLVGVDLARMLALLGMFAAHLIDPGEGGGPGGVNALFQVVAGRSSALFAVLAGVSLALVTRVPAAGDRARLLVRAALVAGIGLVLGSVDSGIAVILVYYGLLFCCALPVLRWRASSLAWLALAWGLLSPVASMLLRPLLPAPTLVVPSPLSLTDPVQLLSELLVTGYYPVLTWATYLFTGLAVGRVLSGALGSGALGAGMTTTAGTGTADRAVSFRTLRSLLLFGAWLAALALAGSALLTRSSTARSALLRTWDGSGPWPVLRNELREGFYGTHPEGSAWWLGVWAPHSGSIVDLAHTTGSALLVLGLCLWLVRLLSVLPWRVIGGAGAMTLTLYSAHVLVLAVALVVGGPLARGAEHALLLHSLGAVAIGAGFAAARWPGPLEHAVRVATQAIPRTPLGPRGSGGSGP